MSLRIPKTTIAVDIKMEKLKGPRLFPKLKDFVNGSYPYNPILTQASLDTWDHCKAEYTMMLGLLLEDLNPAKQRNVGVLIKTRARVARMRAVERKRILAFKKGKV